MSARTFKIESPHMRGDDIKAFQRDLNEQFEMWRWDFRIKVDGIYGVTTRSAAALVVYGLGYSKTLMKEGVKPSLRTKIRQRRRTKRENERAQARVMWVNEQRRRYAPGVARPLRQVLADSWGYHPPTHDGIDLICPPNEPLYAIVRSRVVRADTGGWWGKAPSGDVAKGDGIIVLEALDTVGPIKKGMRLCYGHAEHPIVREGDTVNAGQQIGRAGLAVAWHIHFMVNMRDDDRGVGDRDPEPVYRYAMNHGA